jgi:hypothetical protein
MDPRSREINARIDRERRSIYLPVISDTPLEFYTDTGGGLVISEAALKHLHAQAKPATDPDGIAELGHNARVLDAGSFNSGIVGPNCPTTLSWS